MTGAEFVKSVLVELGIVGAEDTPGAAENTVALARINDLLDFWNAQRRAVYASQKLSNTLTPSLSPHTIGPTGATWTTSQRPVSIDAANLVVGTSRYPINVRDRQWYESLTDPALTSDIPTDLFYNPAWANGALYFYPVPSAASTVELWCRVVLAQLALADTFTMPPGYRLALTLTAAEQLANSFGKPMPDGLPLRATQARAVVFGNNTAPLRTVTTDAGLPSGGSGWFDYQIGQSR